MALVRTLLTLAGVVLLGGSELWRSFEYAGWLCWWFWSDRAVATVMVAVEFEFEPSVNLPLPPCPLW